MGQPVVVLEADTQVRQSMRQRREFVLTPLLAGAEDDELQVKIVAHGVQSAVVRTAQLPEAFLFDQPADHAEDRYLGVDRKSHLCLEGRLVFGLAGEIPLGAILITNEVMRRIEPKWYFRFTADAPMAAHFAGGGAAYGRVGIIHCDGAPAIELLEVVTDHKLES